MYTLSFLTIILWNILLTTCLWDIEIANFVLQPLTGPKYTIFKLCASSFSQRNRIMKVKAVLDTAEDFCEPLNLYEHCDFHRKCFYSHRYENKTYFMTTDNKNVVFFKTTLGPQKKPLIFTEPSQTFYSLFQEELHIFRIKYDDSLESRGSLVYERGTVLNIKDKNNVIVSVLKYGKYLRPFSYFQKDFTTNVLSIINQVNEINFNKPFYASETDLPSNLYLPEATTGPVEYPKIKAMEMTTRLTLRHPAPNQSVSPFFTFITTNHVHSEPAPPYDEALRMIPSRQALFQNCYEWYAAPPPYEYAINQNAPQIQSSNHDTKPSTSL